MAIRKLQLLDKEHWHRMFVGVLVMIIRRSKTSLPDNHFISFVVMEAAGTEALIQIYSAKNDKSKADLLLTYLE